MKTKIRENVLGMPVPKKAYDSENYDKKCPFTGGLAVKKELLKGIVVKRDTNKSATIEWHSSQYIPKYERYEVRRSRLRVHNPPCIDAQVGQTVIVARTRPLSKTKNHVIINVLNDEEVKGVKLKTKAVEEDEIKKEKSEEVPNQVEEDVKENESSQE